MLRVGLARVDVERQNMATLYEKLRLLQGLLTREVAFVGPFAVTVDVTRRCNLRCLGCPTHSPYVNSRMSYNPTTQDLDVDMFGRLCRELQTMNTSTLVFCGEGEPLLHPRLFDLIRLAKNVGFRAVLLTNGTLLDETSVHFLVDSGLDLVRVSLWASSPDEYEWNYPGTKTDYFAKVVGGLRFLASVKDSKKSAFPRVALHLVINRHNVRSVESFVDMALEMRCDAVSFSPLHTIFGQLVSFGLSQQEESLLRVQLLQAKEKLCSSAVEHNIDETIRRYEIGEAARQKVPCYIGWIQPRMKVDGTVRPCNACDWPVGNFREQSFREIWNSTAYRSFRREILSPTGTGPIDERCDCSFCCYVSDNMRVHNFYKWLSPLSGVFGKPRTSRES